jgi:methyl-accepting chemotaxis protein
MSIGKKFTLLISLLAVLISLGMGIPTIFLATDMVQNDTYNWAENEAQVAANDITQFFETAEMGAQQLSRIKRVYDNAAAGHLGPALSALQAFKSWMGVDAIDLVTLNGDIYHSATPGTLTPDGNIASKGYFTAALKGKVGFSGIITPALSASPIPYPVYLIAVPVFVNADSNQNVVAVLLVRYNAQDLSNELKTIKGKGDSYTVLYDNNGNEVGTSLDYQQVVKGYNPLTLAKSDPSVQSLAGTVQQIINKDSGHSTYAAQGNTRICGWATVKGYGLQVAISSEKNSLLGGVRQLEMIIFIIMAIAIVVGIILALFISSSVSKPIKKVVGALDILGRGDLSHRISVARKDEFGTMGNLLNDTMKKISELILSIKTQAASLSDVGSSLSSNMTETAAAINEITSNIDSIKGRAVNQSASVTETSATMEQITLNLTKLGDLINTQSDSVSQASSAIEEMLANIQSVTQTLVKNAENVKTLTDASTVGHQGLQEVSADIQEISKESEGLMEINAVIDNIASQTNLLSMNAAIEAAHAGEAGKGFAVVADEIRKLAESSSEQSKTINEVLKRIAGSISKISSSTQSVLDKFEAITTGVQTVAQQEDTIRGAMEEQSEGSKQILDGVAKVNDITTQVKSSAAQMLEGSQQVVTESHNMEAATSEITNGINEMATGADQINIAVSQIADLSGKNKDGINVLTEAVAKFKLDDGPAKDDAVLAKADTAPAKT